jgi:hypothetical protein
MITFNNLFLFFVWINKQMRSINAFQMGVISEFPIHGNREAFIFIYLYHYNSYMNVTRLAAVDTIYPIYSVISSTSPGISCHK